MGSFEEIFSELRKGGAGYHPLQAAGEGLERLPETLDTACLYNDANTGKQSVCRCWRRGDQGWTPGG